VKIVRWNGEDGAPADDTIAEEEPLEIRVQGASVAVVMRTPGHDEELTTGFLVTERVIGAARDVRSLAHCDTVPSPEAEDNIMQVVLHDHVELDLEKLRRNLYASSSCGVCGKATIENAMDTAPPLTDVRRIAATTFYSLPDRLRAEQAVFDATGGLHAAALFDEMGLPLAVREDIGRHNAVDKVIGWATRAAVDPAGCVLMVSGRVSFEVVQKAAAARIPVVAGISAPSSLAVRLGDAVNLTVVGFLRGEGMNVYSAGHRVTG
jgi:FdhD protein